ncbi:MAG TPA: hypothetical protein VGR78_12655 [Verrucomicrobiae bacterium]|nr:hypothetical protein [Verrucomicrobiae bacterium]
MTNIDAAGGPLGPSSETIRVKVDGKAPDDVKPQIQSYIKRELRSLKDVEISDEKPQYEIRVEAMEISTKTAGRTNLNGYAFSALLLSPLQQFSSLTESAKNSCDEDYLISRHF